MTVRKPNLKKHKAFICAVFAVIIAAVLRQIGFNTEDPVDDFCSLLRSVIYICLFAAWGISVYGRIIHPQVRRYLTAVAALMVLWVTVRTMRYVFVEDPWLLRILWYMYYLPMLFIPFLAVFIAMSLGRSETFRLPKWTAFLYIPTILLVIMVLTNDIHQLVFVFPPDAVVWANDYSYAFGYFIAVGWMVLCAATSLVTMLIKCRVPHSRKVLVLPFIPAGAALIYGVLYIFNLPWLKQIAGDMTVVFCLLFASVLECCIQCGLIQANTHYMELFDASTVGAQITDSDCNVLLSSASAKSADTDTLRRAVQAPVMLDGGIRLSGAPLKKGNVVWAEDMSPLIAVLDELEEAKENLQDNKGILEEEHALKIREAHVAEQDRLYNIIRRDTKKQICLMDEMICQAEAADTEEERKRFLKKMLVIGAYLKRRSNLVFLSDKASMLDAKELELSVEESINNLETFGVTCGFVSELKGPVLSIQIIAAYDFFEAITERALDTMSSMIVHTSTKKNTLICTVDTDSSSDFSDLASDTVTVFRDDDGEWKITLSLPSGGDLA